MDLDLTLILIVVTLIISYQSFHNPEKRAKLLFHPSSIAASSEYYRFITAGFVHGDWGHLISNMLIFWFFGSTVEDRYLQIFGKSLGTILFLFLYISGIAVSGIPQYLKHKDNYGYAGVGSSGAILALMFSLIIIDPWNWNTFIIPIPALIVGFFLVWYFSYMSKRESTSNKVHGHNLWGSLYGAIFMIIIILLFQPDMLTSILENIIKGPQLPNLN